MSRLVSAFLGVVLLAAATSGPQIQPTQAAAPRPPASPARVAIPNPIDALRIRLYTQGVQVGEGGEFPILIEFENLDLPGAAPRNLNNAVTEDFQFVDHVKASAPRPSPPATVVLHLVRPPMPPGKMITGAGGGGPPRIAFTKGYVQMITVAPGESVFARFNPGWVLNPGDNTLQVTLVLDGKVIAQSPEFHIRCTPSKPLAPADAGSRIGIK